MFLVFVVFIYLSSRNLFYIPRNFLSHRDDLDFALEGRLEAVISLGISVCVCHHDLNIAVVEEARSSFTNRRT